MSEQKKMASIAVKNEIQIELNTRPSLRLWQGREKTAKRHGILGVPGFCKILRGVEQAIQQDDPYADYYYHEVEKALVDLKADLAQELKDITSFIEEGVPAAMRLPEVASEDPTVVPIRFASQLGFKMVYEIIAVDQIVLKVLSANHIGLLPNDAKFKTIARVERKVRALMHKVFGYRHTGVTRDDMAANNKKARKAKELMGELEQGYLDGTVRSPNAPRLPQKRLSTINASAKKTSHQDSSGDVLEKLDEIIAEADAQLA